MPQNFNFGGGATETVMSPVALAAMLLVVVLVFLLPRKTAVIPFLFLAFLVPLGQVFYVAGVHLYAIRIVTLAGCLRLLLSKQSSCGRVLVGGFNNVDKAFVAWAACRALVFTLQYREWQALVNQAGFLWDALGGYFLVRYLIRDEEDIRRVAKALVVIAVIVGVCMTYEQLTRTDVFGLFIGGRVVSDIRNGRIRSQGPFVISILAGLFGATLVPLFLWLGKGGKAKIASIAGAISSTVITVTSSSSTPISAFAVGIGALCLWPLRNHMRPIRWAIVLAVLGLALVMKAPVWYLVARVDFAGGSTGWDRAFLIDQFIRHFGDWWMLGTKDNSSWGYFTWDLCNQFVNEGEQGGLATFVLFIVLISQAFGRIGKARKLVEADPHQAGLLWVLGAVMAAHLAGFLGISYFDQTRVWWYATLAMISAATAPYLGPVTHPARSPDAELAGIPSAHSFPPDSGWSSGRFVR